MQILDVKNSNFCTSKNDNNYPPFILFLSIAHCKGKYEKE